MRVSPSLPVLLALLAPLLLASASDHVVRASVAPDPGLLIAVDLATFRLESYDLAAPAPGPSLRVAIGSPSHPTPRGEFHPRRVVRNPGWQPGPFARSLGARPRPPSSDGPLGLGKIPFGDGGIHIHGGAHRLELGKRVSLGCVELVDEQLAALIEWLEQRGALRSWQPRPAGDIVGDFRRPVRLVVH